MSDSSDRVDIIARRLREHLEVLVDQIGERPGGSPGCHQAENYLLNQFSRWGWTVEKQVFDCPAWEDLGTSLRLENRSLVAKANAYSPPCDVQATAVPVGTPTELELANMSGKIGVLYGALLPAPLSPKSWFLKSERDNKIIQLLERKEPAALITVQSIGGGIERLIEDWEFEIPSATVSAEAGREILQAGNQGLSLRIRTRREAGQTANVIGRSGNDRRRVVICAHHDTKYDTPGACDNASGVSVLLALAETLWRERYPFNIELVSFTNEEYMPIGDDEYLRRNGGEDLSDVIACINTDGVGQWVAPDSITAISAGTAFEAELKDLATAYPDLIWAEPWPESNHSTFAFRGVPSVAFTSATRVALAHHPGDDLSWSDPGRIARLIPLIGSILDMLVDKPHHWTRNG